MKKVRAFFLVLIAALAALGIFVVVFPIYHPSETVAPRDAAIDGSRVELGDGVSIHYYESGKGKPVLLIHGFSSWSYTWKDTIPALSERYRVLAPDLPGFGFSDKPSDFGYDYEAFAGELLKFLDARGVKGKVSLVGNSMGGGIAMRFALDHPERVDKLVLVDSAGIAHKGNLMKMVFTAPVLNVFFQSVNSPAATKGALNLCCFYDSSRITPEKGEMYFKPLRTKGALAAAAATIGRNSFSVPPEEIEKIKVPTLIVWGEKDRLISPTNATVLHRMITGSEMVMIPKCGHMPQEEKPTVFNKVLLEFLDSKSSR